MFRISTRRPCSATATRGRSASARELGFSMLEALVSLVIAVSILIGVLTLFDRNNQLAHAQTNVSQMQNSLRVGQDDMMRCIRMAGRGGLPRGPVPAGLAVAVRNNVPPEGDARTIAVGEPDSPLVLPGTDVLSVRGAISSSVYQVNPLGGGFHLDDVDAPTQGSIRVESPHSTTGVIQDLQPLIDAINDDPHGALLLVSPVDTWAVVEIDEDTSVTDDEGSVVIGFKVGALGGPLVRDRYLEISNGFPTTLRNVAHVALLEEYRYYVRERRAIEGDDQSDLIPQLAKARFYPNTELAHFSDSEFGAEIADNILDLQFALGIDADGDGVIADGVDPGAGGAVPVGATSKAADEWLFNIASDVSADGAPVEGLRWNPPLGSPSLAYVRVTTIARTDRRDMGYLAPALVASEDKSFDEPPHDVFNTVGERRFRRRQLQTVVDMRNL